MQVRDSCDVCDEDVPIEGQGPLVTIGHLIQLRHLVPWIGTQDSAYTQADNQYHLHDADEEEGEGLVVTPESHGMLRTASLSLFNQLPLTTEDAMIVHGSSLLHYIFTIINTMHMDQPSAPPPARSR